MAQLWDIAVDVFYLIAACGAIVLALWLFAHRETANQLIRRINIALCVCATLALATIAIGEGNEIIEFLISATYLAWLWVLHGLFGQDHRDKSSEPIRPVIFALAAVELLQIGMTAVRVYYLEEFETRMVLENFAVMLRLLFCTGALVLVHNLYAGAAPQARRTLLWPAGALAILWLYDLNLYTITYLSGEVPLALLELRGAAMTAMLAMLAYGTMWSETDLRFQPSRTFAFRSISLAVIGGYLVVMVLIAQGISYVGTDLSRFLQISFVLLASVLALVLLPSKKMRGWLRVTISKNLFQHRYDYRAEWLRFTDTIGRAGTQAAPLHERAVQAVADIADSPSGLLLTPREEGGLTINARWQWPDIQVPAGAMDQEGVRFFEESQFILDLDDLRSGRTEGIPASASPDWLLNDDRAWAMVPLLHYERLVGIVVLARSAESRMLDWEDFDLLRVIGRQLASYLAEQTSQDALGEAQRFDEFNRRMAFVMHDIKNLASQLSLLAGNAEKHADKAEFRADMILTLRKSTDKLQALLTRLSRYGAQGGGANAPVSLDQIIASVSRQYEGKHALVALEREPCLVLADGEALEQALVHLVQNAIDASADGDQVFLDLRQNGSNAVIEVVDSGSGMSPEFVRTRLFKPFHSTKSGGFGIGAYEARELIRGMGGVLDVESREGVGTRFLIRFPLAEAAKMMESFKNSSALNAPDNNDNTEVA